MTKKQLLDSVRTRLEDIKYDLYRNNPDCPKTISKIFQILDKTCMELANDEEMNG